LRPTERYQCRPARRLSLVCLNWLAHYPEPRAETTTVLSTQTKNGLGFGAISVLPFRLVATALLARDCAAVVPIDRSGHHAAVFPWADGDTAWADADGDI
jgi:hypothetical protein